MPKYKEDIYTYSFVNGADKFSFSLKKNNTFDIKNTHKEFPDDEELTIILKLEINIAL